MWHYDTRLFYYITKSRNYKSLIQRRFYHFEKNKSKSSYDDPPPQYVGAPSDSLMHVSAPEISVTKETANSATCKK